MTHINISQDSNILSSGYAWSLVGDHTHTHTLFRSVISKGKGKGKFHPIAGHEDPEGEQRYSFTLSLISALDEGGWF